MGDQLQPGQTIQKWYAKPQVLISVAGVGYLFLNKKTRKMALLASGALLTYDGFTQRDNYFAGSYGNAAIAIGGTLLFFGMKKN